MAYEKPEITEVSVNAKTPEMEMAADGPSKCSNSCCWYRDGATW